VGALCCAFALQFLQFFYSRHVWLVLVGHFES
jgi:hypothetical protein